MRTYGDANERAGSTRFPKVGVSMPRLARGESSKSAKSPTSNDAVFGGAKQSGFGRDGASMNSRLHRRTEHPCRPYRALNWTDLSATGGEKFHHIAGD